MTCRAQRLALRPSTEPRSTGAAPAGGVGTPSHNRRSDVFLIAVDFWEKGAKYQKKTLYVVGIVWVALMVPGVFFMLKRTAENLFGGA